MELTTITQPKIYLFQTTHDHILDDGRSKTNQLQEAWADGRQAEHQLLQAVKGAIERHVIDSIEDHHWDGLQLDLRVVDGMLTATIDNRREFETERVTYAIKPLEIQDNYEI